MGRIQRIKPPHITEIKEKLAPGRRRGQPDWENYPFGIVRVRNFSFHMSRRIGIFGKHEHHYEAGSDGLANGF